MGKCTLFENARFHTGRSETEVFSYMLVEKGRIKALSNERPAPREYCRRVDLGVGHAYPCLIDGHTHLLYTIVAAAMGFDVCTLQAGQVVPDTLAGVEQRLRAFAAGKKPGELVVANNYIPSAIAERRLPNRRELDQWCGGRAAVVYTIDGHASALSTAMLERMGIDPQGHDGILTGEAHDRAQGRLTDIIASAVTPGVLARGIAAVENACAQFGISHLGALDGNGDSEKDPTTALLVLLARRMKMQVRFYPQYFDVRRAERFRKYQRRPRIGGCGEWEMDGAAGAHSAAFSLPYRDTGATAPCYYTQEQVNRQVALAEAKGYQIASHAIGDRAILRIGSALANTAPGRLHRLEHGEFPDEDCLELYKRGRFAVMMQPGYAWMDKHFLHSYAQFLPPEVIDRLCLKTLVEAGVCVCGSSDSPVQSLNPYLQMAGMVDFYRPEESLSPYQAFRCYTLNAARALEEQEEIGSLEPGKWANFFVADQDLFTLSARQLPDFRPRQSYYGGRPWKERKGSLGELAAMLVKIPHKI